MERRCKQRAVLIIPVTESSGSLVLLKQFRVPFAGEVIEFPAGLIDPNEDVSLAAKRELLEETGFTGSVLEVGPAVSSSAGLTTETVHMAYMRVSEDSVQEPRHEASESISVMKIKPQEYKQFLKTCKKNGALLDAKVYLFLKEAH